MVTTVGPRREDEDDERICIFLDALSTANTSNCHLGQRRAVFRVLQKLWFRTNCTNIKHTVCNVFYVFISTTSSLLKLSNTDSRT